MISSMIESYVTGGGGVSSFEFIESLGLVI